MLVQQLITAMESIAPPQCAAEWDNVGLLVGSAEWPAERILLTIDLTEAVLNEAIDAGVHAVVAYHPPIFQPMRSIVDSDSSQRVVLEAIRAGIAIYSPHTALDAAADGLNDWLARGIGGGDMRALETYAALPENESCKIITFVPPDAVDRLRDALSLIGAGHIGAYDRCSFEIEGTGTFHGGESTTPSVGTRGRLERVSEVRLEMVCPRDALAMAITTLRQFHPYEEPPIEIHSLSPRPQRHIGHGRRLVLDQRTSLKEITRRIKERLGVRSLRVATPPQHPRRYQVIGVCAGAGGSLLGEALNQGCQMYFTGEMRHHDVLAAQARDCTVVLAGHTNTERRYLTVLRRRLRVLLPEATISGSRRDVDPLRTV